MVVGALLAASFPPYGLPYLLPVGFALLLYQLRGRLTPRLGFYVGFACGAVYFGATIFWLFNLFGAAAISLIAIAACFPGLFAALLVWLRQRLPCLPLWLLAATLWTGVEYYRSEPFVLNFGWMGFGYGLVEFALAAKIASWVGSYGVTFLVAALGGLVADAWIGRRYAYYTGLIAVWIAFLMILLPVPRMEREMRVRLVQANSDDEDDLFYWSKPPAGLHTAAILWPEYSLTSDPQREPKLWAKVQAVARDNRSVFIFGAKDKIDSKDEAAFRNTAFVLGPDGQLLGKHVKNHTVHFIRDGVAGTESTAIQTPAGRLGVAICFDMDYPDVARRLAQDGAEVFIVPNDDPPEWGPIQRAQHRLMFEMRAAECGRWLARADVAGGTSVAMPNGRQLVQSSTSGAMAFDVGVGRSSARTPYVRGGWRFGPLCLWASIGLVAWAILRRWRTRVEAQ